MSDDLLARLSAALAEEKQGETAVPAATRGRVLASLQARQGKRRLRMIWGMPLVAVFVGSTAWAGYSGQLPALLEFVSAALTSSPDEAVSTTTVATGASLPTPQPVDQDQQPDAEPSSVAPGATVAAVVVAQAPTEPSPTSPARVAAGAKSAPSALPTVETAVSPVAALPSGAAPSASPATTTSADNLALYRSAHRAQFQTQDYREALQGYARYLEREPRGGLALEARYNSALCLLRLGRSEDAAQALRPFAAAAVGSYRQAEAAELLEALAR